MINNSGVLPYFKLTNLGPAVYAFDIRYSSGGVPVYAYSKDIQPGTSRKIAIPWDATNMLFTVYVYSPPYRLIPIYKKVYWYASLRCFRTQGTIQNPHVYIAPCFYEDNDSSCCNCCCNCCCNPCCK